MKKALISLGVRIFLGAGGRNRTDMGLPPRDFESRASTSFTTPAVKVVYNSNLPYQSRRKTVTTY